MCSITKWDFQFPACFYKTEQLKLSVFCVIYKRALRLSQSVTIYKVGKLYIFKNVQVGKNTEGTYTLLKKGGFRGFFVAVEKRFGAIKNL